MKKNTAEGFVERLLKEGSVVPCDDTLESFQKSDDHLPSFYDEKLFKRGQEFYHRNIFAIFSSKLLGLLAVIVVPTILKILIHTKMSGSDMTAYRRYMATIFHMSVWYDSDFKPGSRLWRSIADVKRQHNSASKRGCAAGLHRINQKDMVLTQFGFIGFALARPDMIGVYDATEEDWKGFIHLWRVVGHILGIEDRFNLCRGTVQETRDICNILIERVFRPLVEKKDKDFLEMSSYLVNGLWSSAPILDFDVVMTLFYNAIQHKHTLDPSECYMPLTFAQRLRYQFMVLVVYTLRWKVFKLYHNYSKYLELWLMKAFPFLAYYRFGIKNAHVYILDDAKKNSYL